MANVKAARTVIRAVVRRNLMLLYSPLRRGRFLGGLLAFFWLILQCSVGRAQVATNITSSGLGTVVTTSGTNRNITGGTRPGDGANLFHSFGRFDVSSTDTANFCNAAACGAPAALNGVQNIIGRVTGGVVSNIFGKIQTTGFGTAALYLINPAGWIFGSTASLNVGGAFRVSTADYIKFPDLPDGTQVRFTADNSPLPANGVTVSPIAFGFLSSVPNGINIQGSRLQVGTGQSLSFIGGDLQISGSALLPTLGAPGGRVELASVASAGEVRLSDINVTSASLGQINISNAARIDGSGNASNAALQAPGGTVVIRGGRLSVTGSTFLASTTGNTDGAQHGVDVQVTTDVTLSGGSIFRVQAQRAGNAGDIQIKAGSLQMQGASTLIDTQSNGGVAGDTTKGVGGNVLVNVGDLSLTGGAKINSVTQRSGTGPGGPGGNLTITASGSVSMSGANSGVTSTTASTALSGTGGAITISSSSLSLDTSASILTRSLSPSPAPGGNVAVQVVDLNMSSGAAILSQNSSSGAGGKLTVVATDSAIVSGSGTKIRSGAIAANATGTPGDISVTAGNLTVTNGAQIQNGDTTGRSGNFTTVAAQDSIVISNGAGISSQAFGQDVGQATISAASVTIDSGFISTSTIGGGRAGDISVNVGTLNLLNGGQIASSSALGASGAGGNLSVNATGSVSISGQNPTGTTSTPFISPSETRSGLFSTASGTGNAGQITVNTPTLAMASGGAISVATSGAGNAGSVALNVNNFSQSSGARVDSSTSSGGKGGDLNVIVTNSATITDAGTGLFSTASGTGAGGNVTLQANNIDILNGATLSANSTGTATATAGNVNVLFGDTLRMMGSSITTGAVVADGGNISLTANGSMLQMTDSQITTSVASGAGSGGNITIGATDHPFDFVILNNSQIRADAFGGPGGNINVFADVFLPSNSVISASSALSAPGVIDIQATFTDVTGSVTQLPESPLKANELLRASCAARFAGGKASSLVLSGRDGLPVQPGGLLPSPLYLTSETDHTDTRYAGHDMATRFSLIGSAKEGLSSRYSLLPNAKCAF